MAGEIYRAQGIVTVAAASTAVSTAISLPVNPSDYTVADILRVEYLISGFDLGVERQLVWGITEDSAFAVPRTWGNDSIIDIQAWQTNFTTSGNASDRMRIDQDLVYGRLTVKPQIYLAAIDSGASAWGNISCQIYYQLKKVTAAQLVAFLS